MAALSIFARQLDKAMKRKGLSQNALARALSDRTRTVSPSIVNRWLKGKGLPEGRYMIRLPEVLGVSADWLMYARDESPGEFEAGVNAALARVDAAVQDVRRGTLKYAEGRERKPVPRRRRQIPPAGGTPNGTGP